MSVSPSTVQSGINTGVTEIMGRYDDADDVRSSIRLKLNDLGVDGDIKNYIDNSRGAENNYWDNQYKFKNENEDQHYVKQAINDFALGASEAGLKALKDTNVVITNVIKETVTEVVSYEKAVVDYFDGQPIKMYIEKTTGVFVRSETILSETTHIPIGKAIASLGKAAGAWAIYETYKDAVVSAYEAATSPGDIGQGLEVIADLAKAGAVVVGGASAAMLVVGSATSLAGIAVAAVAATATAAAFDAATTAIGNSLLAAYNLSKTVEQALEDMAQAIDQAVDDVWDSVGSAAEDLIEDGADFLDDLMDGIDGLLPDLPKLPDGDGPFGLPLPAWFPKIGTPWGDGEDAPGVGPTSPIILDLGATGIDLAAFNTAGSVYWDIDNDEFLEASDWVGPEDGLLCIDLNSDGVINNHSELFGSATVNGYTVLSAYDTNYDNYITSADTQFNDLLVWVDSNSDGISQATELHTLSALNITSIRTSYSNVNYTVDGVLVKQESDFTMNGLTRTSIDAWFAQDSSNTEYNGNYELDIRTLLLPTLRGFGDLKDLHVAMSQDEDLLEMMQGIASADLEDLFGSAFDLRGRVEELLIKWAGAENIDPESRGGHFNGQYLAVLEKFMGRLFDSVGLEVNPHTNSGFDLQNAWGGLMSATVGQILGQTAGVELFSEVGKYNPVLGQFEGDYVIDFEAIESLQIEADPVDHELFSFWHNIIDLIDLTIGVDNLDVGDISSLNALIQERMPSEYINLETFVNSIYVNPKIWPSNPLIDGSANNDLIHATTGNTQIYSGDGDDTIFAGTGQTVMYGGDGNDTFYSGIGEFWATGGAGDDTYVISTGFGSGPPIYNTPFISENASEGNDTLRFTAEIAPENIRSWTDSFGNLFFEIGGSSSDRMKVSASLISTGSDVASRLETVVFADSTVWNLTEGLVLYLPDDNLSSIRGSSGDDLFVGGIGNQQMYGYSGNDTFYAGTGQTYMYGGTGDDEYYFSAGFNGSSYYPAYVMEEISEGTDTIYMMDIDPSEVLSWTDSSGHYHLEFTGSSYDHIVINASLLSTGSTVGSRLESIVFADSTVWDLTEGLVLYLPDANLPGIQGSSGDDLFVGGIGNQQMYGYAGNDTFYAGTGQTYMYGGAGDDEYYFSAGFNGSSYYPAYVMEEISEGTDTIYMMDIDPSEVKSWTDSWGHYHLEITGSSYDHIVINASLLSTGSTAASRLERVVFADSTVWDLTEGLVLYLPDTTLSGIQGSSGDDLFVGGVGNQQMYGYAGNDSFHAGTGQTYMYGGFGDDEYYFSAGFNGSSYYPAYIMENTSEGIDTINMTGFDSSDVRIWTDSYGHLHLENKSSSYDHIVVYAGSTGSNYQSTIGQYVEQVVFDDKTVDLTGGLTIEGGTSYDYLYGTASNDIIYGLDNGDTIYGNDGNDTLYGGNGSDYLTGGDGADKFVFESSSAFTAVDTISDFNVGDSDSIDIADLLIGYDPLVDLITDFVEMTTSGSNSILKVDRDGTGGTYSLTQIASLSNVTGLTDEAALVTNGNLIVA